MNDRGKREPSASMRKFASQLNELYVALQDEGFTEEQAQKLVSTTIVTLFNRAES